MNKNKKYFVQVKDTKPLGFIKARDAIDYFKSLTIEKTVINWQLIQAVDCIQNGEIKLYYKKIS